ncbi:MAG: GatB/YqeY domain-containing protein [Thermodesulfovibrionales bacterium]|nr:GatB/YqeY domain-containing protein [Thermodesulfovibrionales bacterium]
MATVIERLDADQKEALKTKDSLRLSVIRLIKASLKNKQIQKGKELTDEDILDVLSSQAKQRKESIQQFLLAKRADLAEKEQKELEIIESYLPKQLSAEEIDEIIKSTLKEASITTTKEIGLAMKLIIPKIKGIADGKYVNQRVREILEAQS